MIEDDDDDDDRDLSIRLPMDIDPSRIRIEALQENETFIIKVNVSGPFSEEEQETIDGLCEAIDNEEDKKENKEDTDYMRSLN